jgi:hypothetical protein
VPDRVDFNTMIRRSAGRSVPEPDAPGEVRFGTIGAGRGGGASPSPWRRRRGNEEVNARLRAAAQLARQLTVAPGINIDLHDPYGRR